MKKKRKKQLRKIPMKDAMEFFEKEREKGMDGFLLFHRRKDYLYPMNAMRKLIYNQDKLIKKLKRNYKVAKKILKENGLIEYLQPEIIIQIKKEIRSAKIWPYIKERKEKQKYNRLSQELFGDIINGEGDDNG